MQIMRRQIQLLYFIFLIYCTSNIELIPQTLKFPPDVEARIKQFEENLSSGLHDTVKFSIKDRMLKYNIHGISIAVVNNYEIEWAKGYGLADTAENKPVTTETLFQAGSVSKSLNALGVLKLAQENKIGLNTDINNYLKTWQFPYDMYSKDKKITIKNLLSHTAGLSIHGYLGYNISESLPSLYQILDGQNPANSNAVRSMFEPGLKYEYSGGGILISQLIVMDTTHRTYDEYMKENILNPIGMLTSFYTQPPPENSKDLLATAYYVNGQVEGKYHIYPEQAAAGLWTNPTELCKYLIEIQLSYQNKSNKVLSQEMTKLMLTPYIDKTAALGVFIVDNGSAKYFYHGGSDEGFISFYIGSIEDGKGVVMMVNSTGSPILTEIFNSVANVYKWKGYYKPTDVSENSNDEINTIFPNPAIDFINIKSDETFEQIFIFDLFGRKVMESPFQTRIDIRDLNAGAYF